MSEQNYFKSLIAVKNNQPVTSSLHVAQVFGKKHKRVLRAIRNLADQNWSAKSMFAKATYVNRGKQYPMYYMNRDGFSLLAMGFTGSIAIKFKIQFINAFDAMQKELQKPSYRITDPIERAKRWIQEAEYTKKIQKKAKANQSKADYYDKSMRNPGTMNATKIAKNYGFGATTLNRLLHKFGVIYWQGDSWTLYAKYQGLALGSYRTYNYGTQNNHATNSWRWNQRGKKFIYDVLSKHGIKPQSQQLSLLNRHIIKKTNEALKKMHDKKNKKKGHKRYGNE